MSLAERLWRRVDRLGDDDCWLFQGAKTRWGYGKIGSGFKLGHTLTTHRAAWLVTHGEIPDGRWVLHRCDNPPCCNPRHLFLGDALINTQDMDEKGRRRSLPRPGEANPSALLTESQAKEIKRRRIAGEKLASIAADFHVSLSTVSFIARGRNWKHLS